MRLSLALACIFVTLSVGACSTVPPTHKVGAVCVAERTIKWHMSNILRKLGARSRISVIASYRQTIGQ